MENKTQKYIVQEAHKKRGGGFQVHRNVVVAPMGLTSWTLSRQVSLEMLFASVICASLKLPTSLPLPGPAGLPGEKAWGWGQTHSLTDPPVSCGI